MAQNDPYQTKLAVSQNKRSSSTRSSVATTPATTKRTQTAYQKKKPIPKMLLFGAISLGAYGMIFMNEGLVTNTYTLGGWHAVFPVGTAFVFSFIHGAFASNFLEVLGLQPKK